ncbi:tetratricopeptide repeat protein, partial [Bacteroidota bacterium]
MKHFFILILFLSCLLPAYPQNRISEGQLAAQYSNNKEYLKASQLYMKLYKQTQSKFYLSSYITCLINLENYSIAEKEIKNLIRKNPKDLTLYVEQGQLYKFQDKGKKVEQSYENAISKLTSDQNQARSLVNAFLLKVEYEWAEKTYLRYRQIMRNDKLFRFELANIYYLQRKQQAMVEEYFQLLEESPNFLPSVQSRFQLALINDVMNSLHDLILTNLLNKTQANPDNTTFTE